MPRTYSRLQVFLVSLHPGKLKFGEDSTWGQFYVTLEKKISLPINRTCT